jgi:hypothetical protein
VILFKLFRHRFLWLKLKRSIHFSMRLGCDHEFAVLDALGSDQAVTESSDLFALATQDNHFQTEMGIQVHVHRGNNRFEMLVLIVSQPFLQIALMMIVDQVRVPTASASPRCSSDSTNWSRTMSRMASDRLE